MRTNWNGYYCIWKKMGIMGVKFPPLQDPLLKPGSCTCWIYNNFTTSILQLLTPTIDISSFAGSWFFLCEPRRATFLTVWGQPATYIQQEWCAFLIKVWTWALYSIRQIANMKSMQLTHGVGQYCYSCIVDTRSWCQSSASCSCITLWLMVSLPT